MTVPPQALWEILRGDPVHTVAPHSSEKETAFCCRPLALLLLLRCRRPLRCSSSARASTRLVQLSNLNMVTHVSILFPPQSFMRVSERGRRGENLFLLRGEAGSRKGGKEGVTKGCDC